MGGRCGCVDVFLFFILCEVNEWLILLELCYFGGDVDGVIVVVFVVVFVRFCNVLMGVFNVDLGSVFLDLLLDEGVVLGMMLYVVYLWGYVYVGLVVVW